MLLPERSGKQSLRIWPEQAGSIHMMSRKCRSPLRLYVRARKSRASAEAAETMPYRHPSPPTSSKRTRTWCWLLGHTFSTRSQRLEPLSLDQVKCLNLNPERPWFGKFCLKCGTPSQVHNWPAYLVSW